jgi:hypothetical protein
MELFEAELPIRRNLGQTRGNFARRDYITKL